MGSPCSRTTLAAGPALLGGLLSAASASAAITAAAPGASPMPTPASLAGDMFWPASPAPAAHGTKTGLLVSRGR